jgi:hypothetical protein
MLLIAIPVLLEPILDGKLRGQASDAASMLFGSNGCTEHILVPLGFELSLLLELVKFLHFFLLLLRSQVGQTTACHPLS